MLVSKIKKELKNLISKKKKKIDNAIKKIGFRDKQRIHKRGIMNGLEGLKEMFKVLSYQKNLNQNNFEIPGLH
jgi:glutathionyl-hydroquinone reductase